MGRGLQRPAADIPWGEVGRNWFVALWSTSGPAGAAGEQTSLFLVDPAGGRYLVHTWPAAAAPTVIDDWSGDGRRVLLGRAHPAVMDLSTGATRAVTDVPDIMAAGFTRPSGSGFVLVRPMAVGDTLLGELVRVDAPGARPVELAANTTSWVYAADGQSLFLDGRGELRVVDNSGRMLRAIPAPVDQPCRPVRWWSDSRLLVACGTDLWLLSPSTGAWDRLTAPPTSTPVQTFGNSDGFPLGRASYAQADASCGVGYVARVAADGSTTPVKLPGALSGPSLLLGTDAQRRLAVMSVHSCGHDTGVALSWFDPTADQAEVLLGPGLNGGQVLGALEFPDAPRG